MSEAFIYLLDWIAEDDPKNRALFVFLIVGILAWGFAEFGKGIGQMFQRHENHERNEYLKEE